MDQKAGLRQIKKRNWKEEADSITMFREVQVIAEELRSLA